MEAHPYLTISKILYIPSAIALLLFSISGCSRFISLSGFALLLISPELFPHIPEFLFLPLAPITLFSALLYALDLIRVSSGNTRRYIGSILLITASILVLLYISLKPYPFISSILFLITLFSALFYALDLISVPNRRARKYIILILLITALAPPILSSALPPLLCGIYPCTPIFPVGSFSPASRLYIALALFFLYMSFSFFALRLLLDMPEKIGPAEVVVATLIPPTAWLLSFSDFSLFFLGIIPCSAVVYAPLCKMREPMSTIKRILICCQLVSFVFVWFTLPRLR